MTDMNEEVKLHEASQPNHTDTLIKEFINVDAQGKDEKQIADIADLVAGGKCDILIVASNTSSALTPAIDAACKVLPVVEFDRYSLSNCAIVKERSIGGYAFGAAGAQFIIDNLPKGGNVLALRILPGVDVLEQRWGAARQIFEKAGNINIVGVEFGNGDNATIKSIVADYIAKFGTIDAVWMDAGATSVAALEAFKDAGKPYPIITGEDQQYFLKYWKDNSLKAIAPSFSTYMWRTAILASLQVLQGLPVQGRWYLPQPLITNDNLDKYYNPKMPALHYAQCGCEGMPTYPEAWGGTK
jgi:ribose transport system substrate-binding protein